MQPARHILIILSWLACCNAGTTAAQTVAAKKPLPPCISKMQKADSSITIVKYNYKGQLWYSIIRSNNDLKYDSIYNIRTQRFINHKCELVGTWRTGGRGIISVNDITPDTIDKRQLSVAVPDTVRRMALNGKPTGRVLACKYGNKVVFLASITNGIGKTRSDLNYVDRYFDEEGTLVKVNVYTQKMHLQRKDWDTIPGIAWVQLK